MTSSGSSWRRRGGEEERRRGGEEERRRGGGERRIIWDRIRTRSRKGVQQAASGLQQGERERLCLKIPGLHPRRRL
eukprot:768133-Hanusia_phi.AAC.3